MMLVMLFAAVFFNLTYAFLSCLVIKSVAFGVSVGLNHGREI